MTLTATFEPGCEVDKYLQPQFYDQFRCIADKCPDTCCDGWHVSVDKRTYDKYQSCSDSQLKDSLKALVTINTGSSTEANYAAIKLADSRCPFHTENLCSIQKILGEEALSYTCDTYPRVLNVQEGFTERSLDLSCPEAARLTLSNPAPIRFHLVETARNHTRLRPPKGNRSRSLGSVGLNSSHTPEVRSFVLSILQNRKYPVAKRLILVGHVCDKLDAVAKEQNGGSVKDILQGFAFAIDAGLFDDHLKCCSADPATQVGIALELMVARLRMDFTSQRFRDLYKEFAAGLQLQFSSSIADVGARYAQAYALYYAPFMREHEHMMEHYLASYAYKTLFPFGSQMLSQTETLSSTGNPLTVQYILMASYFGLTKALMIGLAAQYKSGFGIEHVLTAVQSCSKTLEHCTSFTGHIVESLAGKGITTAASMSLLTQN